MHTAYQPRRSGDAYPANIQRASGGARGHRTQAGASSVGKPRSAPSGPLNDCACPKSGRGHFLFHAVTSPSSGVVCLGICESFGLSTARGRQACLHPTAVLRPVKVWGAAGWNPCKPGGLWGGGQAVFLRGGEVATLRALVGLQLPVRIRSLRTYNGVAVPSRREAAIGENRGSRASLHRDALGPVLTIGKRSLLLPLAAGARRCGRG